MADKPRTHCAAAAFFQTFSRCAARVRPGTIAAVKTSGHSNAEEIAYEVVPQRPLIETIGAPAPAELELAGILDDPRLLPLVFGVLLGLLMLEWLSRRLRGAG